jgi:Glycosyltransferase family 87
MSPRPTSTLERHREYAAPIGITAVCVVIGLWAWRAFSDPAVYDFGAAYYGGLIAWSSGHPETWFSWTGTPFLAWAMAIVTRLWGETVASRLLTGLNIALVAVTVVIAVRQLRNVLSPAWLWITAVGLAGFGPVLSTVWWKQFNIIALVIALGGFAALRSGRAQLGGGLIGLSIAVKPLLILLPLVLLARRTTRSAGMWALAYAVGLNLAALGLLAAHAHSLRALNPLTSVQNFADKSKPAAGLACEPLNFSPQAMLCRAFGSRHWTLLEFVVWAVLAVLAVWVIKTLRGFDTASWESLAFASAFSVMASPISWNHYQLMLAPLFVLLIVRFTTIKTEAGFWVGLAVSYVLASLVWSPYGTITDAIQFQLPSVYHADPHPPILDMAQVSQYVLVITAALWYRRHGSAVTPQRVPSSAVSLGSELSA